MKDAFKKLSEELAKELAEHINSPEVQALLKATKEASEEDTGKFKVIISTGDRDRMEEIIDPKGWDFKHFKKNPIVLWGHDYRSLPIGIIDKLTQHDNGKIEAAGRFATAEANPLAQQIRRLYDLKMLRAVSVGFIAKDFDEKTATITKAELLEVSFVTVPANPFALSTLAVQQDLNVNELVQKGIISVEKQSPGPGDDDGGVEGGDEKGPVIYSATPPAEESRLWKASEAIARIREWAGGLAKEDITFTKYRKAFAWFDSKDAESFGAYKLPHHDVVNDELQTVWRGVVAAMGALLGARGGVDLPDEDRKAVYNHLSKHYVQFEKTAPEFKEYNDEELEKMFPEADTAETPESAPEASKNEPQVDTKEEHEEQKKEIGAILTKINNRVNDAVIEGSQEIMKVIGGKAKQETPETPEKPETPEEGHEKKEPNEARGDRAEGDAGNHKGRQPGESGDENFNQFVFVRDILKLVNNAISDKLAEFKKEAREHVE